MQVFAGNAAAVDAFAQGDNIAQLHPGWRDQGACIEFAIEVRIVEVVEGQFEVLDPGAVRFTERVQVGLLVPAQSVSADQLDDAGFLVVRVPGVGDGGKSAELAEFLLHVEMAAFGAGAVAQPGKYLRPGGRHAVLIEKPVLVPALDPGCVGAGEVR